MATVIIIDSPGGQEERVKRWLDARGGRWTRGLAQAACEGWAARSVASREHQELQMLAGPVPGVTDLAAPAVGDTWEALRNSFDGAKATLPEPSQELAAEIRRRWVERVGHEVPNPIPGPGAGKSGTLASAGALIAALAIAAWLVTND